LVARDTPERVERLLQKYGYRRPTRHDHDLAPLVGLIFTAIADPWGLDVVGGAESAAHNAWAGITISLLREHGRYGLAPLVIPGPASRTARKVAGR
jgi:DNA-binding LacI/PurR family transcriptional regulator